jgi:NADPH:quinone reductase-like Zn-dependent oxidoreductase
MPSAWRIKPSTAMDWRTTDGVANLYLSTTETKPTPKPKSALVRIRAAALNARDMMVVAHDPIYILGEPDLIPCADGAGIIEEVGEGSSWTVGDRVLITPGEWILAETEVPQITESPSKGSGSVQGTLQEYLVVKDQFLVKAPSHLSFEELAALPAAAGTAVNALFYGPAPFKKGMTVLAQGTGGVSCFVIQVRCPECK